MRKGIAYLCHCYSLAAGSKFTDRVVRGTEIVPLASKRRSVVHASLSRGPKRSGGFQ